MPIQSRDLFLIFIFTLLLAGCQPKVFLMPSPVSLQPGTGFFDLTEGDKDDNRLLTLYATNRVPNKLAGDRDSYTIFPSDDLRLGFVIHAVGERGTTWEKLYEKSLSRERDEDLIITFEYIHESIEIKKESSLTSLPPSGRHFFELINERLKKTADKDITIYIHGANSNLYRATAQAAQYYHFTGHNSLVLTFSWPSAENIFKYKTDVLHAKKTVPAFARLLELLAENTTARNINILSYSAGAQVTAPGLVQLRESYPELDAETLQKRFRIGEVYFAAPDIKLKTFAFRYLRFKDLIQRTTISSNVKDSVLRFAYLPAGRRSRLGRPDFNELSQDEKDIFLEKSGTGIFDLIDIEGSKALEAGKSHSFWYSHPWVSSDLLFLMLFNLHPLERGLTRHASENGLVLYRFPDNYEEKIEKVLETLRSSVSENK